MNRIADTDTIFATVVRRGTTCLSARLTGMKSLSEVMDYLYRRMSDLAGLITIRLRNASEGWTSCHNVMLRPVRVARPVAAVASDSYPSLFAAQGL
ncbi:MAG: hypothetical protein K2H98_02715 [Duncaniella sp.]|nr:hypothetical protein [Duncaniella sp.]